MNDNNNNNNNQNSIDENSHSDLGIYCHRRSSLGILALNPNIKSMLIDMLGMKEQLDFFDSIDVLDDLECLRKYSVAATVQEIAGKCSSIIEDYGERNNMKIKGNDEFVKVGLEDILLYRYILCGEHKDRIGSMMTLISKDIEVRNVLGGDQKVMTLYDIFCDSEDEGAITDRCVEKLKEATLTPLRLIKMLRNVFFLSWRPEHECRVYLEKTSILVNTILSEGGEISKFIVENLVESNGSKELPDFNDLFYFVHVKKISHIVNHIYNELAKIMIENQNDYI